MEITLIKTTVKCPKCQAKLCNLCGFNGVCEDCGTKLPAKVQDAIADHIEDILRQLGDK